MRERERQIHAKGWTPEHDLAEHADGSLVNAAAVLLLANLSDGGALQKVLDRSPPWVGQLLMHAADKYAEETKRTLEIAGALIAAELDRLEGRR